MTDQDDDAWFAPKRYGFGSGLPVAPAGWAMTIGYVVLALVLIRTLHHRQPLPLIAILTTLTIAYLLIAARHTRGGWRWRWGGDD